MYSVLRFIFNLSASLYVRVFCIIISMLIEPPDIHLTSVKPETLASRKALCQDWVLAFSKLSPLEAILWHSGTYEDTDDQNRILFFIEERAVFYFLLLSPKPNALHGIG